MIIRITGAVGMEKAMPVDTVYSRNPQDNPVHHPEPSCGYRQYIERCENDLTGRVETPNQYLIVDVGTERRWYRQCDDCRTIQVMRDTLG